MTAWWEDPQTNWTRDEPRRALELLSHAYDERDATKQIVQRAGIDWRRAPGGNASAWEIWVWALEAGARGGLVFDLVSTVLEDDSRRAFHDTLRKLLGAHLAHVNSRTLARRGMESAAVAQGAVLETLGATLLDPDSPQTEGLQAVLQARSGLADPRGHIQMLVDAMRRTALVEVGGVPMGTGFLVGPDVMLTAAHVLDAHHWPPQLKPTEVEVVFDVYASGYQAPAEVGSRVGVVDFLEGSLPMPNEVQGNASDWNASEDRLDFALVRLARPIAVERGPNDAWPGAAIRGCYALADVDYDFGAANEFSIVQHPLGGHQVLSRMRGPFTVNPRKTRVRYRGNTLNGSSGSAVVDLRGRLVALHHFGNSSANQGIPIAAIAKKIAGGPHASALAPSSVTATVSAPAPVAPPLAVAVDPLSTPLFGRRPFVNRANLRNRIRAMLEGNGGSVLVIEGGEDAGKSYSYRLLSHVANEHARSPKLQALAKGIRSVKIDLDEYVSVPPEELRARLADDILLGLAQTAPSDDSLAQAPRNITTLNLWLKNRLSDSQVLWWVFFDSLDRFVLKRDVGELIFGLAKLVDEEPSIPLRVALVVGDRPDKLPGDLWSWAHRDVAAPLNRDDAVNWLRECAKTEGHALDETKLEGELAKIFPAGGPHPPAEGLASQLARALPLVLSGGV